MDALLSIKSNNGESHEVVAEPVMTVGRDKNNTIVINEKLVSRNHGMIRRLGKGDYYLIDVGSSNGSFVNGRRIATPQLLKDGDEIKIGQTIITFQLEKSGELNESTEESERTMLATVTDIKLITILVADIRGYTALSEQVPIATLTKMMAQWFRSVSDDIESNNGMVDKFIGDCVYARWDGEGKLVDTIHNALSAALAIYSTTKKMGNSHPEINRELSIGVGINTGHAAVGIGTDNTALGDAVNLAFRLETASKTLDRDVVMSKTAYSCLPETGWQGKERSIEVKGKRGEVEICALTWQEVGRAMGVDVDDETVTHQM
ncbi:MAG TPA: adenylate/guanylate cyclase domain-containing protein [Acidiferrobacteraceae bacterium]|nr:adenylate/guanylate cyclase domain-containing protein [Acidiferrobacteraceae bacterium]